MTPEQIAAIDLVLLYADREHSNGNTSVEGVKVLSTALTGVPIVLMGRSQNMRSLSGAMRMGVKGYIPASTPAEIVKHALPLVAVGGVFMPTPDLLDPSIEDEETWPQPDGDDDDVEEQVHHVAAPRLDADTRAHADSTKLTSREVDVLKLLGLGLQNKVIAHRLGLKEGTVKVHVRHVMRKLKVTSRTQAALFAQREFPIEINDR